MDSIKTILKPKSRIKEAAGWSASFDYSKLAYKLLYQVCFSLLSTGRLHLYRGFLSVPVKAHNCLESVPCFL